MTKKEKQTIRWSLYNTLSQKAKDNGTGIITEIKGMIEEIEKSSKKGAKLGSNEYVEILNEMLKDEEIKAVLNKKV